MRTTAVQLTVTLDRVCRDGLIAVASAEIEIAGIAFRLNGLEVRRDMRGRLQIDTPGISHGGAVLPAIELPTDLEAAIGREIEALFGVPSRVRQNNLVAD